MRSAKIRGVSRRRGFVVTTRRDATHRKAPDLVNRRFVADGPNQLWVADMTYVPTWSGFMFLAIVLDVWSRRVVGWAIGEQMTSDLVLAALNMAYRQRRPQGVIHHSDQGSQYTSVAFGQRCEKLGVRPSMGSVGDAYDNAMAESFFATLECELLDRRAACARRDHQLAASPEKDRVLHGVARRAGNSCRGSKKQKEGEEGARRAGALGRPRREGRSPIAARSDLSRGTGSRQARDARLDARHGAPPQVRTRPPACMRGGRMLTSCL